MYVKVPHGIRLYFKEVINLIKGGHYIMRHNKYVINVFQYVGVVSEANPQVKRFLSSICQRPPYMMCILYAAENPRHGSEKKHQNISAHIKREK